MTTGGAFHVSLVVRHVLPALSFPSAFHATLAYFVLGSRLYYHAHATLGTSIMVLLLVQNVYPLVKLVLELQAVALHAL